MAKLTPVADPRGGAPGARPPLFSEGERIFLNIYYLLNKILIYCVIQSTFERR